MLNSWQSVMSRNPPAKKQKAPSTNEMESSLIKDIDFDCEFKVKDLPTRSIYINEEVDEYFAEPSEGQHSSTELELLQEALDFIEDDAEVNDHDDHLFKLEEDIQNDPREDVACSSSVSNHNTAADRTVTLNEDSETSLDEAFERLDECMKRTSFSRELIQKAGLSYTYLSAPNLHNSTSNKTSLDR